MILLTCGAKITRTTVMISAITPNITMAVPTVRPPCFRSPQQNRSFHGKAAHKISQRLQDLALGNRTAKEAYCQLFSSFGALHTAKKSAEIIFYRIHFSISLAAFLFIFLIRLSGEQFLNILIFIDDIFLSYHKLLCLSSHIKLL